jgi:hypothetical protein
MTYGVLVAIAVTVGSELALSMVRIAVTGALNSGRSCITSGTQNI